MSRKANPTLIGAFVLGALALGIITVMQLAGGRWFQEKRQHVLYFEEASQGLQVGAPVIFLGVRIGTVKNIQLSLNSDSRRYLVRVTAEVESQTVRTLKGEQFNLHDPEIIRQLVERGLRAQLSIQSLLTGQLYVDLNFHPEKKANLYAADPDISEIPTIRTTAEELITMLEDFPMDEFLQDLSTIADSVKTILAADAVQDIPQRLSAALANLESLTASLDAAADPLLEKVESSLGELSRTLEATRSAMAEVNAAAGQVENTFAADSQMMQNLTRAGEDLSAAAEGLQQTTAQESPTVYQLNQALEEVSRAARALRLLAESLERQPESIFRGR